MERCLEELESDINYPGSSYQNMDNLEGTPHSDTASINPEISNQDDQSATEGATEGIELAGTRSLNTTNTDSEYGQSQSSLNVLVENYRDPLATTSSNTAADVALPGSDASTSSVQEQVQEQVQEHPTTTDDSCSIHRQRYLNEIRRLSTYMPHLINVRKSSRAHHRARLRCLDFSDGHPVRSKTCTLKKDKTQSQAMFTDPTNIPFEADGRVIQSEEDFIQSFLGNIPSEIDCRVLIVDDLSDTLMYILGSSLHVTPEFFEEHLLNSGWHDNKYEDRGADTWSTRNLTRNYASISGAVALVLLDPLPTVNHKAILVDRTLLFPQTLGPWQPDMEEMEGITEGHRSQEAEDGRMSSSPARRSILPRITGLWRNRTTLPPPVSELYVDGGSQGSRVSTLLEDDWKTYFMFIGSATRLPVLDYEDLLSPEKDYLLNDGDLQKSTASALAVLLHSYTARAVDTGAKSGLLEYLLIIILQDTLTILRSINVALTDIDNDMLKDELLQSNIDIWRGDLNRLESELQNLETSIPEFAQYIPKSASGKTTRNCERLHSQCRLHIAKVQERRKTTHGSLMTAMSLVESKRGISEAESVTKLTELAFFFIPLTFAASLFSMQVKELDANTTSVGVFLAVALTITVCSYALRLVIRSTTFLSFMGRWKSEIRASTETSSGTPIATTTVLRWFWNRINPASYHHGSNRQPAKREPDGTYVSFNKPISHVFDVGHKRNTGHMLPQHRKQSQDSSQSYQECTNSRQISGREWHDVPFLAFLGYLLMPARKCRQNTYHNHE
ncbi:MAG: hypothetical protein Q9184_004161 [Pyrenodesmia sp. 2 TL-2023]